MNLPKFNADSFSDVLLKVQAMLPKGGLLVRVCDDYFQSQLVPPSESREKG